MMETEPSYFLHYAGLMYMCGAEGRRRDGRQPPRLPKCPKSWSVFLGSCFLQLYLYLCHFIRLLTSRGKGPIPFSNSSSFWMF